MERRAFTSFDVRPHVQDAFNQRLRAWLKDTIWPGYTWQFRRALRAFEPRDYELR